MDSDRIKTKRYKIPILKLILTGFVFSAATVLAVVLGLMLLLGFITSFLGIVFAGLGLHNVVAVIVTIIGYKILKTRLMGEGIETPGVVAFTYIFTFVTALVTVVLVGTKLNFANIDPGLLGLHGVADSVVNYVTVFIAIFGLLIFSAIQEYASKNSLTKYLILLIPLSLCIYTRLFFTDSNDLKRYDITKDTSVEIRQGKALEWYLAPSENPFKLSTKHECLLSEGAKTIECSYDSQTDKGKGRVVQMTARLDTAMADYLYHDGKCSVQAVQYVMGTRFNEKRDQSLTRKIYPNIVCTSFATKNNTPVYYSVERADSSSDKYDGTWELYFIKNSTIVTLNLDDGAGNPHDLKTQTTLGDYIDSFQ